jgi:hypothetical protein
MNRKLVTTEKAKADVIPHMNYNFFADRADKIKILDLILNDTDLRMYDLSSPYGQEISEYKTVDEVEAKFDLDNGDNFALCFQLWTPRHKGKPVFRKIELDPKRCNGHTFRYSTDGWGLIQLYLGGIKNNQLNHSHLGHFGEKGALKLQLTNTFNGRVSDWDWTEIQLTSRKLKQQIRNKMVTRKIESFDVLHGAERLERQGLVLV